MFKCMFCRPSLRAFTLLEAVVALLVISGSCLLFQALTLLLFQDIRYQERASTQDWLLFTAHLEQEFLEAQFDAVSDHEIYVDQQGKGQKIAYWPKKKEIRKTGGRNQNQGSQTLLFGVESMEVEEQGGLIQLKAVLADGQEREWIYRVD
ncbi:MULTISPECIES: competence type IV pilus minor pilin ComGF [unclassified Streptococcus]|uniref:competence type IV pilus minor pilin ComGF n=1 Tax=unclassified Streptococcus TaxID=2608887 RepID=UPI001072708C|nr:MULTISPECIES: competence type IV pilus minor pilin ComGF [unclassified Streptococcus]MBF0805879.1 competence protein ComGF [Streptococcus sp. 19428wA2_WM07]TFU28556.1 competence protein ComGF [Streptococcus sp. WM07]